MFYEDDQVNLYNLVQVCTFLVGSLFCNVYYLKELYNCLSCNWNPSCLMLVTSKNEVTAVAGEATNSFSLLLDR